MMTLTRTDLLALTQDGLIQLANAGLVKRGLRELAAGQGPQLAETEDGTVEARFADGTLTRLAAGRSPGDATCTCPASGMCRHRVALVLAYQAAAAGQPDSGDAAAEPAPPTAWNPADFTEAGVDALLSASGRNELARLLRQALEIHLDHGAVPSARLPMATVRFLVPGEIAYARCDCALGQNCAHIALAVRAFRLGREQSAQQVWLGEARTQPAPALLSIKETCDALLERLLREGITAGPGPYLQSIEAALRAAEQAGATWLTLALQALEAQINAYAGRSARYSERETLALASELFARPRADGGQGAGLAFSLGIGEAMETAMAQTRLVSLGARLRGNPKEIVASILLADTDTGSALLLDKTFTPRTSEETLDPEALPGRSLSPGLSVRAVARGQLLTAVARRRADGSLVLGVGRGGKTALMPHAGRYDVPAPMAVSHLQILTASQAERPPLFLRPRHRVRDIHVFRIERFLGQAWAAGAQVWKAAVELADDGGTLYLERSHDAGAPQAMNILFAAAEGKYGPVRQIAGTVRFAGGVVVCDPWSLSADTLIVPDVDAAIHPANPPQFDLDTATFPLAEQVLEWLGEALHLGSRRLPADYAGRGQALAERLRLAGYLEGAERLATWLRNDAAPVDAFGRLAVWMQALYEE